MEKDYYFITGGAGFVGSNFVINWLANPKNANIVTIDKLTYAGNCDNLKLVMNDPRHTFIQGNICDKELFEKLLTQYKPLGVIHFAAETHVDRSIHSPQAFIDSNVVGTCNLLDTTLHYWKKLDATAQEKFRFIHISTDEVYGSLSVNESPTTESSPYKPNSPYAASKASSDHFARAYHKTYGLPVITTHSSNNFGPYQFPEKLVPLTICNSIHGKPIPLYGDGQHSRNWIYVKDTCEAICAVIEKGTVGEKYNIGDLNEITNIELVSKICQLVDALQPNSPYDPHHELITFVDERPGHDRRYALDTSKIQRETGWIPEGRFDIKLEDTVRWYLENNEWIDRVLSGEYRQWIEKHYKGRV